MHANLNVEGVPVGMVHRDVTCRRSTSHLTKHESWNCGWDRTRAEGRVQVLVDDLRWMVHLRQGPATAHCSACGCVLNSACYSTAEHGEAHCLGCAFGDHLAQVQREQEPERRSS